MFVFWRGSLHMIGINLIDNAGDRNCICLHSKPTLFLPSRPRMEDNSRTLFGLSTNDTTCSAGGLLVINLTILPAVTV